MSPLPRRKISKRNSRDGIGRILFTMAIIVSIVITAVATFTVMSLKSENLGSKLGVSAGSNFIATPSDILPISANNQTSANQSSVYCNAGNWSAVYAQYESPLNVPQNSTIGQQYLNDSQFIAFLSQYLNMSDPYVNATVTQLLAGNESSLIQQQMQANSPAC